MKEKEQVKKKAIKSKIQQAVTQVREQMTKQPQSIQKLYFNMMTTLHQGDDIVKQGFIKNIKKGAKSLLNKTKRVFKDKNDVITDLVTKFCDKYKFSVTKKSGTTKVGSWGKWQQDGQYIILLQGDANLLNSQDSDQNFEFTLKVLEGEKPNKPVKGLADVKIVIDKGSDIEDIADAINKQIKPKLGFQLSTQRFD